MFKKGLSIILSTILTISLLVVQPFSASAEEKEVADTGASVESFEALSEEETEPVSIDKEVETFVLDENDPKVLTPVGVNIDFAEVGVSKTADEAAQWAISKNGQALDYDGHYGAQCVDFIYYYYSYLGVAVAGGHAYYYMSNSLPSGWYRTSSPSKGDIIVWDKDYSDPNNYGHIGIVVSVSGGYIDYMDQNSWEYGQKVGRHNGYLASRAGTYIHPDFTNPIPAPSNPWFSANKSVAVVGDNITFTFGANDATSYTIGIDKDGTRIITEGVTSGKSYTFDTEGTYSAYVSCYNSTGYIDSPRAEFKVFRPCNIGSDFYANIYNAKSNLAVGADITNNVYLQTRVDDEDNQKWHFQRNTDGSYRITNVGQDRCLDVSGGTANFEENIQVWQKNDSDAQKWYIRHLSTGYVFVPKCNTSSAMDIYGGTLKAGTNIRDFRSNESNAQIFSIDYLDLQPVITKEFNGHKYELYNVSTTWDQAYKMCEEMGGHLVTITSKEENEFVLNLSKQAGLNQFIWLGGYANGDRKWFWVTDEGFSYSNWGNGEPNNSGGNEDRLHMTESGAWNDIIVHANANTISFVCEYEDSTIDESQYIPNKTTLYNDSKYEFYNTAVTWKTAKAICEAKGGHLVIINNSGENSFANNLAQTDIWMGITDSQHEAQWVDVFGNAIPYSNWADSQPDNHQMCENYGEMYKNGTWNDHKNFAKLAFVCEYENAVSNLEPAISQSFNGHKYELYNIQSSWFEAYRICKQLGGHLATISSAEENEFVARLANTVSNSSYTWLGGSDVYSEGKWFWITDESFSYTNWNENQPDNYNSSEHYLHMYPSGKWNDSASGSNVMMFICEYETFTTDSSLYSPQKTTINNNSVYEVYRDEVTWERANEICKQKGGHLVIINSKSENEYIQTLVNQSIWLGINDKEKEGTWIDSLGNKVSYTNWDTNQPDNCFALENYGELWTSGKWNDEFEFVHRGFICEYDNAANRIKPVITSDFNGHKYELYDIHVSWNQAYKICEDLGGHLVTVTSKEENDFVMNLAKSASVSKYIWLGGADYGSEGNWYWITAEPFSYSNWSTNEPNNTDEKEHFLNMFGSGTWNDMPVDAVTNTMTFVCEYEEFQVDETKYSPVKTILKDNTFYEFYEDRVNWTTANAICEQKGGHLITIDSKAENDIAVSLISEEFAAWIGYSDTKKDGEWVDSFGNKASYSNWTEGEPNNHWDVEHYAEVYKTGLWNDTKNFGSSFAKIGFICEYDNAVSSIKPDKTLNKTGHKYELFNTKMSWKDAYQFCEKKGGHLVTINSNDEDAFIYEFQKTYSSYDRMWLGATDEYSEGMWKWVTGDSIDYKNWADGEPNDDNDEDFMMIYKNNGKWNDAYNSTRYGLYSYSFICEYDNITDASTFNPTKEFEYNENHYEVYSDIVDWQTAKRICELKGGHLLVVDSKAENDFVFNQINNLTNEHYWMGLTDAASEGNWQWLVPTTSAYSNWNTNEPNNDGGLENYGEMIASSGKWNDMAGYYCIHRNIGFICEYEASPPKPTSLVGDTNLDGAISISDVTAIQRHLAESELFTDKQLSLADTNGDGVINITDATHLQKYLAEFDGIVLGKQSS